MTLITLEPDVNVEPGHQWLVLPDDLQGAALAILLTGSTVLDQRGEQIYVGHTAEVDARLVAVINELAHVRFQSPTLVQLTMQETLE